MRSSFPYKRVGIYIFLNSFYEKNNSDQFFTLAVTVLVCSNHHSKRSRNRRHGESGECRFASLLYKQPGFFWNQKYTQFHQIVSCNYINTNVRRKLLQPTL